MTRIMFVLSAAALALTGMRLDAHHSMAEYRTTDSVTIQGEVVGFEFRNPHSFVHVVVTEGDGTRIRYAVEWGASSQLASRGVRATTLQPGDEVIITGFPTLNPGEHRLRLVGLERPKDGFVFRQRAGEVLG